MPIPGFVFVWVGLFTFPPIGLLSIASHGFANRQDDDETPFEQFHAIETTDHHGPLTLKKAVGYERCAFRRFAQYAFIRFDTAAFGAADIFLRRRFIPAAIVIPSSV